MKRIVAFACAAIMLLGLTSCAKTIAYDLGGGTVDQSYIDNADFEALVSSKPTKEGYVFVGWYSDADFTDRIDPKNITKEQKKNARAFAKWIVVEEVTYFVRDSEASVTDAGRDKNILDEVGIKENFNISDLKLAGYTYLKVRVTMEVREVDDGYQYVFLYKDKNCESTSFSITDAFDEYVMGKEKTDPSELYVYQYEHDPDAVNTSWGELTFETMIPLSELSEELYIRYDASGSKEDTWVNKNVKVTVDAVK